ncbi:MAG TPA: amidohydrolase family protein [Chitinophagales bacterium]|nr:amidohydrolase family protein [Chitinophagales bacterium]HRK26173.1 amidohydrolase family protein [Chitinophagales bacterium]
MNCFKSIFFLFLAGIAILATAQTQDPNVPLPAPPQTKKIALMGATAHVGNGQIVENSVLVMDNGKITAFGDGRTIKLDLKDATIIDVSGKHIYPGIIAAGTALGLSEIAAVRATQDRNEVGDLNPNIRSIIAYNTDSEVLPTLRSNGILMAQVAPQGGVISGASTVVHLDAWNWEDAAYKADEGVWLNWSQMFTYEGWWAEQGGIKLNEKYGEQVETIKSFFEEARAYCQTDKHPEKNLKMEAMCGLFNGTKKLFVNVNYVKEIVDVVNFAKKYGLKLALSGAADAWQVTDLLKANNVSVIINQTHSLPNRDDEDYDLPYKLPKLLQDAGVLYCITVGAGYDAYWQQRNLPFHAGTAAAFGLTKEQALSSITLNAAKILGIDQSCGSLESGKDATILVTKGDLLDMRTSVVEYAFIQGRQINLDNKQKALYRKFMTKYGLKPGQE